MNFGQLFRMIRGGNISVPAPPTGGGGGGGGVPPPITLSITQVKCHEPKALPIVGNLAPVTSSDLPVITDTYIPSVTDGGFLLSPARNVVQWDPVLEDDAGIKTFHLSDGVNTVALQVEKLMNLYLPGVEKLAPVGTPVAWLYGYHGSTRPTLGGAAASYFALKGWQMGGIWYWWLAVNASLSGLSAPSTLAYTIASSGLTTISGTIDILVDTGFDMDGWPDPDPPIAPSAPTSTRSSTKILASNQTIDGENIGSLSLAYKQSTSFLSNISITNVTGDGAAQVMRNSGGSGVTNFTVQKVSVVNGRYVQGIGFGGVRIGNNPCTNVTITDISWVSIPGGAYATSEDDISGGACIQGKIPTKSYAGNLTFQRIHVDGLYMNTVSPTGATIFPNGDGVATERYDSWLGPITITDVWFKGADGCVDCKAITGTVINRVRMEGGHYCVKDWTGNVWDNCKSINLGAHHIIGAAITTALPTLRNVRKFGTRMTDVDLMKFQDIRGATMVGRLDIPAGMTLAQGDNHSLGSFLLLPDGTGLYQTGNNGFTAFTPV
jgi:hypothetical protein